MSAVFGERLTLPQEKGGDITLVVEGDEFYSIHETLDGFTVLYNFQEGQFCYATMIGNELVATEYPASGPTSGGLSAAHARAAGDTTKKVRSKHSADAP